MVDYMNTTNKGLEKAQQRFEQAKQALAKEVAKANTLIEKIEVHNPVVVNGAKEQKLTVYYKFVGQID